jgi:hypothetical protein
MLNTPNMLKIKAKPRPNNIYMDAIINAFVIVCIASSIRDLVFLVVNLISLDVTLAGLAIRSRKTCYQANLHYWGRIVAFPQ